MPEICVEYTTEPKRAKHMLYSYRQRVMEWKRRMLLRRIFLVSLGLVAILMRFGLQADELPTTNPTAVAVYISYEWYEHPVLLFLMLVLFAPFFMLSFVATEETEHHSIFLEKLGNRYCEYLQGLFSTSILVDLLLVCSQLARSAGMNNDSDHIQDKIDPFTHDDQLWLPKYHATMTAYIVCFCAMRVNKSLNYRFSGQAVFKIVLRAILTGVVTPIIVAISIGCYNIYIKASFPIHIEFHYPSVFLGLIVAIFEIQGWEAYESTLSRYYVVLRFVPNGELPPGIILESREPADSTKFMPRLVSHIGAQCYRHHQLATQRFYSQAQPYKGKNVGA